MTWHYGLLKTHYDDINKDETSNQSYDWYEVIEIYPSEGYAKDLKLIGESRNDIIKTLQMMIDDLSSEPEVIDDDTDYERLE